MLEKIFSENIISKNIFINYIHVVHVLTAFDLYIIYTYKVKLYGYGVSKNSYSEFRDCSLFREFLK